VAEPKVDLVLEVAAEILEDTLLQKEPMVDPLREHQAAVICTLELEEAEQAEQEIIMQVHL
jgi:hypothetical protein